MQFTTILGARLLLFLAPCRWAHGDPVPDKNKQRPIAFYSYFALNFGVCTGHGVVLEKPRELGVRERGKLNDDNTTTETEQVMIGKR